MTDALDKPRRMRPDLALETKAGWPDLPVAGVDEVGRGPLAGPVVAAAVIIPADGLPADIADRVDDSKALKPAMRVLIANRLLATCPTAIGRAEVAEIDDLNILRASWLAMARAVASLPSAPAHILVDGNRVPPDLGCPATPVVGGDRRCLSIAAASIVAKVARDREMAELAARFPGYGWERNAGYPTAEHRAAIDRLGITPHHRRSFSTVSQRLSITR